jgi:PadR family transcriptional regulator PadR
MNENARAKAELPLPPHMFEVLLALSEGPGHGYAIIKEVERQSEGAVTLSTSSLYAALKKMELRSLVEDAGRMADEASGGPPRKYFRISTFGQQVAQLESRRLHRSSQLAAERFLGSATSDGGQ